MHVTSILNDHFPLEGFAYKSAELDSKSRILYVTIEPHKRNAPICSRCGSRGATYDHLPEREFDYTPFWEYRTKFIYRMRRCSCPHCNVIVTERVPWASGKSPLCHPFAIKLAKLAKATDWSAAATFYKTSWHVVAKAVEMVVDYGREHLQVTDATAIGIDEIAWQKGHKYITLAYQLDGDARRLLWVGEDRTNATMEAFAKDMKECHKELCDAVKVACTDMWQPFIGAVNELFPKAANVLDRFHIMKMLSRAMDDVRADEQKRLKKEGKEPVLNHTRFCFLKNPNNLTEKQSGILSELMKMNLTTVKAYTLKEQFRTLWDSNDEETAGRLIDEWCASVQHSNIGPFKRVAKTIQNHRDTILNYFRTGKCYSSGIVEGLNRKANLLIRRCYGFRTIKYAKIMLYHMLGNLPEPPLTHRFV